jgi:hypothetical protein
LHVRISEDDYRTKVECADWFSAIEEQNEPNKTLQPTAPAVLMHIYEVRRRKDHRGGDLTADALPFGRLWYGEPEAIRNAIGDAKFDSRST